MRVVERSDAGKSRVLRLLDELEASAAVRRTEYLTSGSVTEPGGAAASPKSARLAELVESVGESETGMAVFWGDEVATVVLPPFPIGEPMSEEGVCTAPLVGLLKADFLVAVVLLRLGHYGVGVLRGDSLVASKSGSRYVKSRHRAGGSSQRRFERSRERLVRELFDKCCETAVGVLAPFRDGIGYVLMGGEKHTLREFRERCGLMRELSDRTLARTLKVDRPGKKALEGIGHQVWKSTVVVLDLVG